MPKILGSYKNGFQILTVFRNLNVKITCVKKKTPFNAQLSS